MMVKLGLSNKSKTPNKKRSANDIQMLKRIGKIYRLPKNVRESVPFRGILDDGIKRQSPGHLPRRTRYMISIFP